MSSSDPPPAGGRDGAADTDADEIDASEPATVDVILGEPPDSMAGPTGTHSLPGPASAASRAPRSVPSVPRVGIPRALRQWERYEVLAVLGSGGMGAVYKARDPRLSRFVALKIVHPLLGQSVDSMGQVFARRFEREARLQASFEHPHICKVYEIGELPRQNEEDEATYPYIAMQLISGKPLHRAQTDMSLFEKVRVIQQVADALHAAHRHGLIHRDIKPSELEGPAFRRCGRDAGGAAGLVRTGS